MRIFGFLTLTVILATSLFIAVPAHASDLWCPPLDVHGYRHPDDGLGAYIARSFSSPVDAAMFIASMPPDAQRTAQMVLFTRSRQHVVIWKSSAAERDANVGRLQRVVVTRYRQRPGEPIDGMLLGAAGHFGIEYVQGLDVALVTTNDPQQQALVITLVAGDCPAERRRSTER